MWDVELSLKDFRDIQPLFGSKPYFQTKVCYEEILRNNRDQEHKSINEEVCSDLDFTIAYYDTQEENTLLNKWISFIVSRKRQEESTNTNFELNDARDDVAFVIDICPSENQHHYIALVTHQSSKKVYVVNSKENNYKETKKEIDSILKYFANFHHEYISCPQQIVSNSICHAFVNARMLQWAIERDKTIENVSYDYDICSVENMNKVVGYKLTHCLDDNDDSLRDEDDEMACYRKKEEVDMIIRTSIEEMLPIEVTIEKIKLMHFDIKDNEMDYIYETYKTETIQKIERETISYISRHIKNFDRFIAELKEINNIERIFELLSLQKAVLMDSVGKNVMSNQEQVSFIKEWKYFCWNTLKDQNKNLTLEKASYSSFMDYLKSCFLTNSTEFQKYMADVLTVNNTEDDVLDAIFDFITKSSLLSDLTNLLKDSNPITPELKSSVSTETRDFLLSNKFSEMQHDDDTLILRRQNNRVYITCSRSYLRLSVIAKQIEKVNEKDFEEVRIIAKRMLIIDECFVLKGKNLILVSPQVHIVNRSTIDLSGIDGVGIFETKAKDGKCSGDDGKAGIDGTHGSSGGNVCICTDEIFKPEHLKIISNGGNGSNGQNGGDGKKGKDGKDGFGLSKYQFKDKVKDPCKLSGYSYMVNDKINRALLYMNKTERKFDNGVYVTGENGEGNQGIYSFFSNKNLFTLLSMFVGLPNRQAYFFLKGTSGVSGKKGGDGGKGGDAGNGGYAGTIEFKSFNQQQLAGFKSIETINTSGKTGKPGTDGNGGSGGRNGIKGEDNALLVRSQCRAPRWFHGSLQIKFSDEDSAEYAWCVNEKRYARIVPCSIPHRTCQKEGQRGKNVNKEKSQRRQAVKRNPTILTEDVASMCKEITVTYVLENCQIRQATEQKSFTKMDDTKPSNASMLHQILLEHTFNKPSSEKHAIESSIKANPRVKESKNSLKVLHPVFQKGLNNKQTMFIKDTIDKCNKANTIKIWLDIVIDIAHKIECQNIVFEAEQTELIENVFSTFLQNLVGTSVENFDDIEYMIGHYKESKLFTEDKLKVFNITRTKCTINKLSTVLFQKYKLFKIKSYCDEMETLICSWIKDVKEKGQSPRLIKDVIILKQLQLSKCFIENCLNVTELTYLDRFLSNQLDELTVLPQQLSDWLFIKKSTVPIIGIDINSLEEGTQNENDPLFTEIINNNDSDYEYDYDVNLPILQNALPSDHNSIAQQDYKENGCQVKNTIQASLARITDLNIRKVLSKLQYCSNDYQSITLLLEILVTRFECETIILSNHEMTCIVTQILNSTNYCKIDQFIKIFATAEQKHWSIEILLLQIVKLVPLEFDQVKEYRKEFLRFGNKKFIVCLNEKLMSYGENNEQVLNIESILKLFRLGEEIEFDEILSSFLQEYDICNWEFRVRWFQRYITLKDITVNPAWKEQEIVDATYMLTQCGIKFGHDITMELLHKFKACSGTISSKLIHELLQNVLSNYWVLDPQSLAVFNIPPKKWIKELNSMYETSSIRTVDRLVELMTSNSNNSISQSSIKTIASLVESIHAIRYSSQCLANKLISNYNGEDIKRWRNEHKANILDAKITTESMIEVIAVVNQAIFICKGFRLRDPQLVSIISFLYSQNELQAGMLQQVATGEGKSLIIVALAIFQVLRGYNIDVITSSSVLARRDAVINDDLYQLFNVKVGHNCSEKKIERKTVYGKCSITYGELGAFQRDLLLDGFYNEDMGINSRSNSFVIVDEVDSMLLDKGQNVLYLSHDIPGMQALEDVYVRIWNFVHSKDMFGTAEDVSKLEDVMRSAINTRLRQQDFKTILYGESLSVKNEQTATKSWKKLIKANVIDTEGIILQNYETINEKLKLNVLLGIDIERSTSLIRHIKDVLRQGTLINIPTFLVSFVKIHLLKWIENAFKAKYMVQNDNYILDFDRTDACFQCTTNVVIIDKDTGVEQYHSQWSQGLHQFLQLKHGCRLSYESLKAVFLSNVTFFSKYQRNIFGLTGTLGSESERNLLQSLYSIEYLTVPSFRPKQFRELVSEICIDEENWLTKIVNLSLTVSKNEMRPILVICESVLAVEKLVKRYKQTENMVHVYKHGYQALSIGCDEPIDKPCIIVATNLAGRGTDIQISQQLSDKGGLFVCLTYLPNSCRVEEQAFGRAARKGQQGSGKIICISKDFESESQFGEMMKMKVKRNEEEMEHLEHIKRRYETVIKVEEKFFLKFQNVFSDLKRHIEKAEEVLVAKKLQSKKTVILNNCLDNWAFWLDKANHEGLGQFDINEETFMKEMNKYIDRYNSVQDKEFKDVYNMTISLVSSPSHKISLAKLFLSEKEYEKAKQQLRSVLREDSQYLDLGHYYIAHCIIKESNFHDSNSKTSFIKHLHKAEEIWNEICSKLSNHAATVSMLAEGYKFQRNSFLYSKDYSKQKEDIIAVYQSAIGSINDILGHKVTESSLDSISTSPILNYFVYQDLKMNGILSNSNVSQINGNNLLKEKYGMYYNEIETFINTPRNNSISINDLKYILPSKEEVWDLLRDHGIFLQEKTYVIINFDTLKTLLKSTENVLNALYKKLKSLSWSSDSITENKNAKYKHIYLYPEQLEDVKRGVLRNMTLQMFDEEFGNQCLWECLQSNNIITFNKKGILDTSKKCSRVGKYDHVNIKSLLEIEGIDESKAKEILVDLESQNIIKKSHFQSSDYVLLVSEINQKTVKLTCHQQYLTEVLNVLHKNFLYTSALKAWLNDYEIMNLSSKPHLLLYDDLINMHIIEPAKVNRKHNEIAIKNNLQAKYGRKLSKFEEVKDERMDGLRDPLDKYGTLKQQELKCLISQEYKELDFDLLWEELKSKTDVFKMKSKTVLSVIGSVSDVNNLCTSDRFECIVLTLKLILLNIVQQKENIGKLTSHLEVWREGLSKFDVVESNLKELREYFPSNSYSNMQEDLSVLISHGLSHFIVLSEEKWTFWCIFKIAAIVCIGIAQIALGIVIELFTVGAGTLLATGLISEGIRDIMFAIECAAIGYCTWKAYAQHKLVSLCILVCTMGVGALLTRGAKFSKYGYKIGGEFLQNVGGKELLEEAGKNVVFRAMAVQAGKKIVYAGAMGLANVAVDKAIPNLLDSALKSVSESVIDNLEVKLKQDTVITSTIKKLCKNVGIVRARKIVEKIDLSIFQDNDCWTEINSTLANFTQYVSGGFNEAIKKLSYCGDNNFKMLSKISNILTEVLKQSRIIKGFDFLLTAVDKFIDDYSKMICNEQVHLSMVTSELSVNKEIEELVLECTLSWKTQLTNQVKQRLTSDFVSPALQELSTNAVFAAGSMIKKGYSAYKNKRLWDKLSNLRDMKAEKNSRLDNNQNVSTKINGDSEYNKQLTKLLKKTRDPILFSEIIREGVPVGIHCVQAMSEVLGRPIKIKTENGDGKMQMPDMFNPSSSTSNMEPIILNFHVSDDPNEPGHFTSAKSTNGENQNSDSSNNQRYNCLFEAVSNQSSENISRDSIANIIETNSLIQDRIKRGIHEHFIRKGGTGGVQRTKSKHQKMTERLGYILELSTLSTPEKNKFIANMRDLAEKAEDAIKKSGNDEIFQCAKLKEWHKLARENVKSKDGTNYLHAFLEIRVDTRYVIWEHRDTNQITLQGHTGALFSNKVENDNNEIKLTGKKTKGQAKVHYNRTVDILKSGNDIQSAMVSGLNSHLKNIISIQDLLAMENLSPTYTTTGHNLEIDADRTTFAVGYAREQQKIYMVAVALNKNSRKGLTSPKVFTEDGGILKNNDPYIAKVKEDIQNAKNIHDYGTILRSPAPYHK